MYLLRDDSVKVKIHKAHRCSTLQMHITEKKRLILYGRGGEPTARVGKISMALKKIEIIQNYAIYIQLWF